MNGKLAQEIADAVKAKGFDAVTAEDVMDVERWGAVSESVIGDEYDEALTERIRAELDERGIA